MRYCNSSHVSRRHKAKIRETRLLHCISISPVTYQWSQKLRQTVCKKSLLHLWVSQGRVSASVACHHPLTDHLNDGGLLHPVDGPVGVHLLGVDVLSTTS